MKLLKGADGYELTVPCPHEINLENHPCNLNSKGYFSERERAMRPERNGDVSGGYNVQARGTFLFDICSSSIMF